MLYEKSIYLFIFNGTKKKYFCYVKFWCCGKIPFSVYICLLASWNLPLLYVHLPFYGKLSFLQLLVINFGFSFSDAHTRMCSHKVKISIIILFNQFRVEFLIFTWNSCYCFMFIFDKWIFFCLLLQLKGLHNFLYSSTIHIFWWNGFEDYLAVIIGSQK